MEEKIFVGFNYGRFTNDDGELQDYCNVFVIEDFTGSENQDYHFGGQKAAKYGCVEPKVWEGIVPGTRCQFYFNSKKKVSYMVPVK